MALTTCKIPTRNMLTFAQSIVSTHTYLHAHNIIHRLNLPIVRDVIG